MEERRGHGWWPYLVPLFSFLLVGEAAGRLPEAVVPYFLPVKVLVPGGFFLMFWRRGAYPELRGYQPLSTGALLDVLVGLAGGAIWMAPFVWMLWARSPLWDTLPEWMIPAPDAVFDPAQLGASLVGVTLAIRCVGYGVVTPFVEELFMRSWLARFAVVLDRPVDFRDVAIGTFSWRSFAIVTVFFTIGHVPWEWPVAVLWVVGTQLWFYQRRHLMALVVVHAASNLGIFAAVLAGSGRITDRAGEPIDLFFFI